MLPLYDSQRCRSTPYVNYALIVACVVVFLYEQTLSPDDLEQLFRHWGTVPRTMLASMHGGRWVEAILPSVTSQFLHAGWLHLVFNLVFLHIFGDNVEDRLGHWRYLLFYLLCGLAADAAHIASNPVDSIPAVGASGAISGVMGAYLTLFPDARVTTLTFLPFWFGVIEISAYWYVTLALLTEVVDGLCDLGLHLDGRIAHWAHVGGLVAGVVLVWYFDQGERWRGSAGARRPPWRRVG